MKKLGLFFASVIFSTNLFAADFYVCSKDVQTEFQSEDQLGLTVSVERTKRVIEVIYKTPDSLVPCEVRYTKGASSEGLWRAETQAGYCESKAKEFVDKQVEWGWSCFWTDK